MAKILAKKINSNNQKKLIKVRHSLDFYREELGGLEEKYQAIIDRKLNAFLVKGNKKISKLAFEACNKEEYAQQVLEDKLQSYDIKAYMKHRKLNHGTAKKIFELSSKGEPIGHIVIDRDKKASKLKKKRAKYVASLEKKKAKFIKKHKFTYVVPYRMKREALEKEYYQLRRLLSKSIMQSF